MGMKKLARRRLYSAEKEGIDVSQTIGISEVMKPALVSATQHREGHKLITDIVLDLGSSAAGLKSKSLGVNDPIGNGELSSNVSYIAQVTDAVFGIVTAVDTFCLEQPSDGTMTDFDLVLGNGDGFLGSDAGSDALITNHGDMGAAVGKHCNAPYDAEDLKNKYIYIVAGQQSDQKASAIINCASAVHGNMTNGVDTIRLITSDGATQVNFVANSGGNHEDAGTDGQIKIGGMASAADLAQAISKGIHANANFTTDTDSQNGASTTVTVTHAASTATSNHDNYLLNDDPQASNGIVVGAFTGGIDDGASMTAGKFLIRFTGFVDPTSL